MDKISGTLICDSGTGYLKLGWSKETFPSTIMPSLIGRPLMRYESNINGIELKPIMIGEEAAKLRQYLELSNPLEEGKVNKWDELTLLWQYAFNKANVNYGETSILMTEPVFNPKENREKMAEIVFENFGFNKMQIGIQALMSLFAEGLFTSCLLDSGDGVTHVIPVVDGTILNHAIKRSNVAGRHITQYLIKLLLLRGYAFNSTADFELVREIKEKACFVSDNPQNDRKLALETTFYEHEYKLPDGQTIKIGRERFEAPELLFNPLLDGLNYPGASEMVFDVIQECPIDCRKELYRTIMISGGTSTTPGFPTRMYNDIVSQFKEKILKNNQADISKSKIKIELIDPPRRKYNVFIGSCVYANTFEKVPDFWITKQEYQERGINAAYKNKLGGTLSV